MKRREFLKGSVAAAGSTLFSAKLSLGMSKPLPKSAELQKGIAKRLLGTTGKKLSIIGFGGIVVKNAEPAHAAAVVAESVEKGVNYFDVAPLYGDAEIKLGPALEPFRKNTFLACKTLCRDRIGAKEELDRSLKRLKTDHFDLYQLHGIQDVEKDVKAALAKDGAIQTFLEAKKAGIIQFIGFSAHTQEAALTAMREFDFDTILYPINFCCHFKGNFDQQVLAEAKKRKMGILAIKAMAKQKRQGKKVFPKCWYDPIQEPELAKLALSWTLSQGVTSAIPPGEEMFYRLAMDLAPACKEITPAETAHLKKLSADLQPLFSI